MHFINLMLGSLLCVDFTLLVTGEEANIHNKERYCIIFIVVWINSCVSSIHGMFVGLEVMVMCL